MDQRRRPIDDGPAVDQMLGQRLMLAGRVAQRNDSFH